MTLQYFQTSDRPEATLTLPDGLDVSTGYTFSLRIGRPGMPAVLEKTNGITGGVGVVTVAWTAGELAAIPCDFYTLQLTATTGTLDRVYQTDFHMKSVIQPAIP